MTCLNFAGTGSWILIPAVSSYRRVIPSRKITLNSNGEINYRELARRLWANHGTPSFLEVASASLQWVSTNCRFLKANKLQRVGCLGTVRRNWRTTPPSGADPNMGQSGPGLPFDSQITQIQPILGLYLPISPNRPVSHSARHQRPTRERHIMRIASRENVDNQAPRNTNFTQ